MHTRISPVNLSARWTLDARQLDAHLLGGHSPPWRPSLCAHFGRLHALTQSVHPSRKEPVRFRVVASLPSELGFLESRSLGQFQSSVLDDIWFQIIFFSAWAALFTCLHQLTGRSVSVNNALFGTLGGLLSFVVSLRTSSAYERFAEGRKCFSTIQLATRNVRRNYARSADLCSSRAFPSRAATLTWQDDGHLSCDGRAGAEA